MIRWRLVDVLEAKGWTSYRLAKETGLTISAAYRLAKEDAPQRLDVATLDAVCAALDVQPGELLVHVTDKKRGGR